MKKKLPQKTILFLNFRFGDFYSPDLFSRLKQQNNSIRVIAAVDEQFKHRIGSHIAPFLDEIFVLSAQPKLGFLAEFAYEELSYITQNELINAHDVRIVCTDEFNLMHAGRLRREYGLLGHTDNILVLYRNKVTMKERLKKANIRVPKFKSLSPADDFAILQKEFGSPFIIKPLDSCGSHGVYIIREQADFNQFKHEINAYPLFEVEEYIQGQLYHVDSCIIENQLKFICANEYTYANHEYTQGYVLGSIPLDENNPLAERLIQFAKKCLNILGANNLVNHMELFVTQNDEIVFLEISARPPGAYLNLTHRINFGINLMDEDFFIQSGMRYDVEAKPATENAFFAMFPLVPGKVLRLNTPNVKSRFDITWYITQNKIIKKEDCTNIVGKSAHAIFYNKDKNILRKDFDIVKNHKAIEVLPL